MNKTYKNMKNKYN